MSQRDMFGGHSKPKPPPARKPEEPQGAQQLAPERALRFYEALLDLGINDPLKTVIITRGIVIDGLEKLTNDQAESVYRTLRGEHEYVKAQKLEKERKRLGL